MIRLINAARAQNGLPALVAQAQLIAAAREHSLDMACNNYAGHTGSDGSTAQERVRRQGYAWTWIGENYYVGHTTPQATFDWWIESTPHRNNILSAYYSQVGVGYAYYAQGMYGGYYTIVFAHP